MICFKIFIFSETLSIQYECTACRSAINCITTMQFLRFYSHSCYFSSSLVTWRSLMILPVADIGKIIKANIHCQYLLLNNRCCATHRRLYLYAQVKPALRFIFYIERAVVCYELMVIMELLALKTL